MTKKQYLSLADFAADNSEDVAIIMSRLPAAGVFICRGVSVEAKKIDPKSPEQDPLITISFTQEILEADPLNKELDPESFVGRNITERYVLWPNSIEEAIGTLRGRYKRVGLPSDGPNGGTASQRGWLDGMVDWPYEVRVYHYMTKAGEEQAKFDWKKADDSVFEALGLLNDDADDNTADEAAS